MNENMRIVPVILILLLTMTSCFEEEEMVLPHEQGNLEEGQVALGPGYDHQVYFDLHLNREVTSTLVTTWDLSFDCSPGGWIVRLNSAKFMYAGNSNDTTFSAVLNKADLDMRFDKSDGNPDSTALGPWFQVTDDTARSRRDVYLVDRGSDELFKPMGLKKVQFDISGQDYKVRYANNDNTRDTTVIISKDNSKDCIYYSFDNGVLDVAPEPEEWSLLFTKYTTMLQTDEGEDYPYLVLGTLLNPNGVTATPDTIHDFVEIELADTIDLELSAQSDVIGYSWKYYNFDAGLYTIEPGLAYVIRDRDGFYYKLRFIDFYSLEGLKGYPKFEYIRL